MAVNGNNFTAQQMRQQQEMLTYRGQQMAAKTQKLDLEGKKGTKKQLLGTILAIAGVVILFFLLAYFKII